MTTYGLIDVANLFYRIKSVVRGDAFIKSGLTLTIAFRSLRKMFREYKVDHFVFCSEGKSWRYAVYPEYKAARKLKRLDASRETKDEEQIFFDLVNEFMAYVQKNTRCTVLQNPQIEGDDFIARWIYNHPDDKHIILSGDSDFLQLLDDNVSMFNAIEDCLITKEGVFNKKGEPMYFTIKGDSGKIKIEATVAEMARMHNREEKDKKKANPLYKPTEFTFTPEENWWQKCLFIKLVRGDSGDGVFSAYPGVRLKGSLDKPGINEAWEDRKEQGFHWNNFMLQEWDKMIGTDQDGHPITKRVRVIDEFMVNESLIDLTKQPDNIKDIMDETIVAAVQKEKVQNVGIHFMRFCNKHDLPALLRESTDHAEYLNHPYV